MLQRTVAAENDNALSIVADAYRELCDNLGQPPQPVTLDTPLYGGDNGLDSLSLVLLVSAVEEGVRDRLGVDVLLASERAMSMRHSPYRTVGTLVAFIEAELAAR